jgi:lipoate-protein ligase A
MNERIRELVKQAGGEFWQRLENDTVNPEAYITFDPPESLEKFAELIVRECVIRAEREWIRNGSDTEHNKAITGVIKSIKEHFGVEE